MSPRSERASGIALVVIAAVLALVSSVASGCGGRWDAHVVAAQTAHATAETGRTAILAERKASLDAAAVAAQTASADIAAAIDAAAATWDGRNQPIVDAYNLFAGATNTYIAAAFAALEGNAGTPESLRALAAAVAREWNALAALLESTHVAASVPRLPDWLLTFLESGAS